MCFGERREFGTEGSRKHSSWQRFLLPPRPGPVTRAGSLPILGRLIRILLLLPQHACIHLMVTDRPAGLGAWCPSCRYFHSDPRPPRGLGPSASRASGSVWPTLWREGSENPQARWVVTRMWGTEAGLRFLRSPDLNPGPSPLVRPPGACGWS